MFAGKSMGSSGEQRQLGLGIGPYSFLPFSLTSEPVKPFLENGKEQIRACNFLVSARWVFWDRRHVTVLWTGLDWGFWFWGVILYSSSQGLAVLWAGGTSGMSESTTLNTSPPSPCAFNPRGFRKDTRDTDTSRDAPGLAPAPQALTPWWPNLMFLDADVWLLAPGGRNGVYICTAAPLRHVALTSLHPSHLFRSSWPRLIIGSFSPARHLAGPCPLRGKS